jgi:DNA-binding NarL/FixJ family response regulator
LNFPERTAVLLDHQRLWLEAVDRVVQRVGVEVVGKASEPDTALALLGHHHPDLFIADVKAAEADMDATTLLRLAREHAPRATTVVLSAYDDRRYIAHVLEAGAQVYVLKRVNPDDLASTIRQVFDNCVFVAGPRPEAVVTAPVARPPRNLTRRELEILRVAAEGRTNAQIAKLLTVTEETVKFHLSNIYQKLDVSNRTEAGRWAQTQGLLTHAVRAARSA